MIDQISFEHILPIWRDKLWPGRQSPIEPISSILYHWGYDIEIKSRYKPNFFAFWIDGEIVGVNSGHQTSETHYRSRGIWVDPKHNKKGIGTALIQAVEDVAMELKCKNLWSIPRKLTLPFYERCGFIRTSNFFDHGMEYGPNCYSLKEL